MRHRAKEYCAANITSVDDVLLALESIIRFSKHAQSRAGYFAVIYHMVTAQIRDYIIAGRFEDGQRMERVTVLFAKRYLEAWEQWQAGAPITGSWKLTFDTGNDGSAIVLQDLLLGINAHINLDLGIAAMETMDGCSLQDFRNDFTTMRRIMAAVTTRVQNRLMKINPLTPLLGIHLLNRSETLVHFKVDKARDGAWKFASEMSTKKDDISHSISVRDRLVAAIGHRIANPGPMMRLTLSFVRLFERRNVHENILILQGA